MREAGANSYKSSMAPEWICLSPWKVVLMRGDQSCLWGGPWSALALTVARFYEFRLPVNLRVWLPIACLRGPEAVL